jgi:GT2 family glycosyltransferase/glycosyltransferase involved in cell wall biosynthesis
MRAGFEGSQDYDLALRTTELARRIGHIPKVLYHWRVLPGSTASSGHAKPASFEAGRKAVQEWFDRRGLKARVLQPDWAEKAGCGIFSHSFGDQGPRVAIIIPTKNGRDVLETCLKSIGNTTYRNYEVVIIDNGSDDSSTLEFLQGVPHRVLRIESPGGRFNYAYINNRAVEEVDADFVLFLNNDTEVLKPEWLSQMVGYLRIRGVGAVGARLLFPDGRIQHAGVVHGLYHGMAGPAFKLLPANDNGYLSYARVLRNYSAVTAACLLTDRELFLRLGGLNDKEFGVAYNDVDYCYRVGEAGYRVVYCPDAELTHHEGFSRGFIDSPMETAAFRKKYVCRPDPYYNPNLSLDDEHFAVEARTLPGAGLKPIRTLMCAFNLNWEGAAYSQFEMTVRLKENGIIDPLVFSPHDGPLIRAYERNGIKVEVHKHPLAGVRGLLPYERSIEAFSENMRRWRIELVYGNTLQTFYAIDAARKAGLPSIWNPRESEPWQTYFDNFGPDLSVRALSCFNYPYKVIFVADATRAGSARLDAHHNFTTIHNGLDRERLGAQVQLHPRSGARRELGLADDQMMVLLLGTVCERKGQLDLVEAVRYLEDELASTIRCFIVGDRAGEYSERLRTAQKSLPGAKPKCIRIVPETADTGPFYSAADLFACTSRIESFPRVILEAMACGLPIVTTPVFGIREQVRENVNALFYEPGDVQALAKAISMLKTDSDRRRDLAANSRYVLESINDYETMVAAYGRVFQEAWLSGRARKCAE